MTILYNQEGEQHRGVSKMHILQKKRYFDNKGKYFY